MKRIECGGNILKQHGRTVIGIDFWNILTLAVDPLDRAATVTLDPDYHAFVMAARRREIE